ncbi:MAG: hypothetical protein MO846_06790 [Candidatus Devosia symbiotica]|nr:hypothetical protein [Candidatus Devosia symbiotica]
MVISLLLQGDFGFTPLESGPTNILFSVGFLVASVIAGRFGAHYLRARSGHFGGVTGYWYRLVKLLYCWCHRQH